MRGFLIGIGTLMLLGGVIAVITFSQVEPIQYTQYGRVYSPYMASRLQTFVTLGAVSAIIGTLLIIGGLLYGSRSPSASSKSADEPDASVPAAASSGPVIPNSVVYYGLAGVIVLITLVGMVL